MGNFVAFPAEILRTSAHLIEIGARELTSTNPFIRQMGARRLSGALAVFGGTGAIISEAAEKITGVTSDKKWMLFPKDRCTKLSKKLNTNSIN